MDYDLQIKILLPDRVLYIWESEKKDEDRRKPLSKSIQVCDRIETILENVRDELGGELT